MFLNRLSCVIVFSALLYPTLALGTTIASEEFNYGTLNDPTYVAALDGSDGGAGWSSAWSDPSLGFIITSPGLTHPAQINSPTDMTSNNILSTSKNAGPPVAIRNLTNAPTTIQSVLSNSTGDPSTSGLWTRFLFQVTNYTPNSNTGLEFTLNVGSAFLGLFLAPPLGGGQLFVSGSFADEGNSIFNLDETYMAIIHMQVTNTSTGRVNGAAWLLDNTTTSFSSSMTPTLTLGGTIPGYNSDNTASVNLPGQGGQTNFFFDELYIGGSVSDINVVPEPATLISLIMGGGVLISRRRKRQAARSTTTL